MAFPSDLVRTKNWGTEILTDADLEAQLDLIVNWVMASLHATTGHDHTATGNLGPKVSAATGLKIASQAQGDILYASSATAFARLGAGTAGQALTTGGAAANPAWAGMTTQGDVEYHNGTTRTRLGPGTAGQILKTLGAAANPAWANAVALVTATRDISTASGNQDVTGFGFDPRFVIVVAAVGSSAGLSFGYDDFTNRANVADNHDASASTWTHDATKAINLKTAAGAAYSGTLSSITDGVRIAWTKTGSPTGTARVLLIGFP